MIYLWIKACRFFMRLRANTPAQAAIDPPGGVRHMSAPGGMTLSTFVSLALGQSWCTWSDSNRHCPDPESGASYRFWATRA